jgi:UDP-2,4-diacetamido-2,4,6-trideoxy-beta-L-altropyranose hydrolase
MNIAFRVDASYQIGTGHVMRCLTLAEWLRKLGCHVLFICRDLAGNLNALIEDEKGFDISTSRAEGTDIEETRNILQNSCPAEGWDWLIIDHYQWDASQESQVRPLVKHILVIDDLANRVHDCDVLLDQNYFPQPENRYEKNVPISCDLLLGPYYALLRPEFAELRKKVRPKPRQIQKLLVSFGGSDPTGETLKVLDALSVMDTSDLSIHIILGASNPAAEQVEKKAARISGVKCYRQVDDMAQRMVDADLFIGAGGTTTWERMAVGLPAVVIAVADNQMPMSIVLADGGYQVFLGASIDVTVEHLRQTLSVLIQHPGLCRKMGQTGMQLVDGLGCQRVAQRLMEEPITLRLATIADAEPIFEWRNHEETRRYSLQSDLISWEAHQQWFYNSLANPHRILLIGEQNGRPVGVLRYDCLEPTAGEQLQCKVSVYRTPGINTPGIGTALLKAGSCWLQEQRPEITRIQADILPDNIASQRAFEKAGYVLHHQVYEYPLRLGILQNSGKQVK